MFNSPKQLTDNYHFFLRQLMNQVTFISSAIQISVPKRFFIIVKLFALSINFVCYNLLVHFEALQFLFHFYSIYHLDCRFTFSVILEFHSIVYYFYPLHFSR